MLSGLKNDIISIIRPELKSLFGIHDHIGLRYLFQSRLSLNPQMVTNGVATSVIHLASAIVAKTLKILVIFYFYVHFMPPKELHL